MSLWELLVVVIVALLVIKPEDLPKIFAKFRKMREFITNTKKEIKTHLDPILGFQDSINNEVNNIEQELNQMNIYLAKIAEIGAEYDGNYSLPEIKKHYRRIIKDKAKNNL